MRDIYDGAKTFRAMRNSKIIRDKLKESSDEFFGDLWTNFNTFDRTKQQNTELWSALMLKPYLFDKSTYDKHVVNPNNGKLEFFFDYGVNKSFIKRLLDAGVEAEKFRSLFKDATRSMLLMN